LLYFGFAWQAQPVGGMSVELWQSLPDMPEVSPPPSKPEEAPPPPPQPEKVVVPEVPPPQPVKQVEPEIAVPDKKAKPEKKKPTPVPEKKAKAQPTRQEREARIAELAARERVEQAERARAQRESLVGRIVDEHIARIIGKVRRNIVMPPDVADDARAEFAVTLLPGGGVLRARLISSSGNALYDNAVERAILKSQPLPLPADATLFNRFRELKLVFRPVE
jgi:colicin import membrane protein